MRGLNQHQPKSIRHFDGEVEILVDRNVFNYVLYEVRRQPSVEEGGKYIGYIFKPGYSCLGRLQKSPRSHAILVTDFLPSGLNAVRTAVEFMPDGEYQEALFRRAELRDPAIEHVGSWHSHQCNGLQTLSDGDVEGYLRTVNKAEYRLDFFFVSLVKHVPSDPGQRGWIDHFLFVRGLTEYYRATDHIQIVDWPTIFGALTGHSEECSRIGSASPVADTHERSQKKRVILWYETEEGRRVLAEDKRLFTKQFGEDVVATRRGSHITLTGQVGYKAISVTYPGRPEDQEILVSLREHNSVILRISCELSYRKAAFTAAVAAAQALEGS